MLVALHSSLLSGVLLSSIDMDPTYPFFPIACFVSAFLMILALMNKVVRQSWNLGVTMICLSISCVCVITGTNAILWAKDASIKYVVWCDIGTCPFMLASILNEYAVVNDSLSSCPDLIHREAYVYSDHLTPSTLDCESPVGGTSY